MRALHHPAWGRRAFLALPWLWLALFFLLPFAFVLKISLAEALIARPPYAPLVTWNEEGALQLGISLSSWVFVLSDSFYLDSWLHSLRLAAISTLLCLLIGYPVAWGIARAQGRTRALLLALVILPFWSSFLIRVYAWKVLLQSGGVLNTTLLALGIIKEPLAILFTDGAVLLGIVYSYLPFMILPLYAQMARLDYSLIEAALDLGSRPWQAFARVTLPLSLPGIVAGAMLVFIPATGEFVVPELLGGPDSIMIGRTLWNEFFANRDWPMASTVAVLLLVVLVLPILLLQRAQEKEQAS